MMERVGADPSTVKYNTSWTCRQSSPGLHTHQTKNKKPITHLHKSSLDLILHVFRQWRIKIGPSNIGGFEPAVRPQTTIASACFSVYEVCSNF